MQIYLFDDILYFCNQFFECNLTKNNNSVQKKIGLFFGSFNPIHIGHLALANYFLSFANLNEVWIMVSPQNPFKTKSSLLNFRQRFNLVYMALEDHPKIKASNFESKLPVPSYTSVTLAKLSEKYTNYEFNLIIGSDNLVGLKKWKNIEYLLDNFKFLVYPRESEEGKIEQISSLRGGYVSCGFNKNDVKSRSSITSVIASEGTPRLEREKYVSLDGFK